MAKYISGTATDQENFYAILRAHLTNNGWTEFDVVSDTTGNRSVVFQGTALDATTANKPLVQMVWNGSQFYFVVFADWDSSSNTAASTDGGTSYTLTVAGTAFNYYIRANGYAASICTEVSSTWYNSQVGFVRRCRPAHNNGTTKLSSAIATGGTTAVLPVSSDMTGKIRVGQTIHIIDQKHSTGGTFGNAEGGVVQSITSNSITLTGNTTNAYSADSWVGVDPYPMMVSQASASAVGGNFVFVFHPDGGRTATNGQAAVALGQSFTANAAYDDPSDIAERVPGHYVVSSTTASHQGTRGTLYNVISGVFTGVNKGDLLDEGDGSTDAVITYVSGNGVAILRND